MRPDYEQELRYQPGFDWLGLGITVCCAISLFLLFLICNSGGSARGDDAVSRETIRYPEFRTAVLSQPTGVTVRVFAGVPPIADPCWHGPVYAIDEMPGYSPAVWHCWKDDRGVPIAQRVLLSQPLVQPVTHALPQVVSAPTVSVRNPTPNAVTSPLVSRTIPTTLTCQPGQACYSNRR